VDDDRVGAIAARRMLFLQVRPVSHLDAGDSARGNKQSLGVDSIPDGSDSPMELPLRPRDREVASEMLAIGSTWQATVACTHSRNSDSVAARATDDDDLIANARLVSWSR
jgi:hypothetical protein